MRSVAWPNSKCPSLVETGRACNQGSVLALHKQNAMECSKIKLTDLELLLVQIPKLKNMDPCLLKCSALVQQIQELLGLGQYAYVEGWNFNGIIKCT